MSTEQSLEDRAREFCKRWHILGHREAITVLLRVVDREATERATEAARGEVERLRGELRAAKSAAWDKCEEFRIEADRLRERLAVGERLVETARLLLLRWGAHDAAKGIVKAPKPTPPELTRDSLSLDIEAKRFLATPAAPVTPAETPTTTGGERG